jgi:hypothetical protein
MPKLIITITEKRQACGEETSLLGYEASQEVFFESDEDRMHSLLGQLAKILPEVVTIAVNKIAMSMGGELHHFNAVKTGGALERIMSDLKDKLEGEDRFPVEMELGE